MHLPNNHQSQFAGFAHKTSKINKIKNPDKPVVVKLSPLSVFELNGLASICLHWNATSWVWTWEVYVQKFCIMGPQSVKRVMLNRMTLDSLRRFLIELWKASKEIRCRWLIGEIITGMLNPLTCTKKDIGELEWAQKSCTDYSKFQKLGIHETSAQPSVVLLKQN